MGELSRAPRGSSGEPRESEPAAAKETAGWPGDDPGRSWMLEFQRGDGTAFDRIVLEYRGMVSRFLGRYLRDRDRAEDVAQEVFLRVYGARHRYRPTAGFRTWLLTIAVRLCRNELRSRRRERRAFLPFAGTRSPGEDELREMVPDRGARPVGEDLERKELQEAVNDAIESLPPSQRAAILLVRFEDLSYGEIAEALGVSVMAVKSLIHRGRENLRWSLKRFLRGG